MSLTFDVLFFKRAVNKHGHRSLELFCMNKCMRARHSTSEAAVSYPRSFLASLSRHSGNPVCFDAWWDRVFARRCGECVRLCEVPFPAGVVVRRAALPANFIAPLFPSRPNDESCPATHSPLVYIEDGGSSAAVSGWPLL